MITLNDTPPPEPTGQNTTTEDVDYDVVKEEWCEYILEDGTKVRVRLVVTRMQKVLDHDGNPLLFENGEPQLNDEGSITVITSESKE